MTARIKFTGYIDADELAPGQYDADHPTGLTSGGYDDLVGPESQLTVSGLQDLEVTVVIE